MPKCGVKVIQIIKGTSGKKVHTTGATGALPFRKETTVFLEVMYVLHQISVFFELSLFLARCFIGIGETSITFGLKAFIIEVHITFMGCKPKKPKSELCCPVATTLQLQMIDIN